MSNMENPPCPRRGRSHNLVQWQGSHNAGAGHRGSRPSGKFNKRPPLLPDTCYKCGKGRHQKAQDCKALDATCRGCGKKGHYEESLPEGKTLHTLWKLHRPILQGQGPVKPLYFNDEGQPVYTYMVSVPHVNKHLIKFPVALEPTTLKGNNVSSPQSTQ